VIELLKHDKVDVNFQDISGDTAFLMASENGHTDIVVELLKHDKVDVNLQNNHGWTALMRASGYGQIDTVVHLLKQANVMVNLQTQSGDTALALASINGHTDAVWELLKYYPSEILAGATAKFHTCIAKSLEEHPADKTFCDDKDKQRFDSDDQPATKKQKR
jgi:ankyrin repeat protein